MPIRKSIQPPLKLRAGKIVPNKKADPKKVKLALLNRNKIKK